MSDQPISPSSRVIVFDIGNVLVNVDITRLVSRLKNLFYRETEFIEALSRLRHMGDQYELGSITTDEFIQTSQQELNLEYNDLVALWNDIFSERRYILPFLQEMHEQNYTLVACSNTNELHMQHLLKFYPCFSLLHHFIFSYRVHVCKPDPAIYRAVEAVTGKASFEHIFLDDLLENVAGASKLGWDAIHFQNPTQVQAELLARGIQFTPWDIDGL